MMKNLVSSGRLVEIYHQGGGGGAGRGVANRNISAPPWLVGLVGGQECGRHVQLEPLWGDSRGDSQRVGWTLVN